MCLSLPSRCVCMCAMCIWIAHLIWCSSTVYNTVFFYFVLAPVNVLVSFHFTFEIHICFGLIFLVLCACVCFRSLLRFWSSPTLQKCNLMDGMCACAISWNFLMLSPNQRKNSRKRHVANLRNRRLSTEQLLAYTEHGSRSYRCNACHKLCVHACVHTYRMHFMCRHFCPPFLKA